MALARLEGVQSWNPFRELESMSQRLNNLVGLPSLSQRTEALGNVDWSPRVDINETPEAYEIEAELPGVKKEDMRVSLEEGLLTISGERRQKKEDKGSKVHRIESSYGSFMRRFTMPADAVGAKIDARCDNGILHVKIPRSEVKKQESTDIKIK